MEKVKNKVKQYLLPLTAVLGLFSCSDHKIVNADAIESTVVYPPPITVLLDTCPPPKITRLKDVPKPKQILLTGNSAHTNKTRMTMGGDDRQPVALFTNFNTEHGLSIPLIRGAFMDKKGRLWFGSNGGGVTRYDGTEFITLLDGTAIYGIAEDIRGWLWFATAAEGAICYDGVKFTNYTTKDGLADNLIFNIFSAKDGSLWFATFNGASRFDGARFVTKNFSNDPLANNVNMITEDKSGNLWFILFGGGLCRYNGREYKFYTRKDGLPTHEMLSMLEDSKGNFWFGSFEQGITRFDGTAFTTLRLDNKPEYNTVSDIEEDSNGDIWFATGGIGAIRYDGKEFTRFTTAQGLPSNVINNIVIDKHGNLWFATSNGISRYQGKVFTAFSHKQGLPQNYITSITEDSPGNFWFGTVGSGLIRYDGEDFFTLTTEHGLPNNFSTSTILDKIGNLWIGINGAGVCRFDGPQQLTRFTTEQGLAGDDISGMCLDSAGNLWIGTYLSGVSRYDGKEFMTYTKAQGLPYNGVNTLMTDSKGNLWFGIQAGGVTRFDGKSFTTFSTAHGLAGNDVYGIEEDRFGNLWIATITGLSRYDGYTMLSFNSSDGLPDDVLVNITEDAAGTIWLGSNKGFCSLKFKTPPQGKSLGEIKGAGLFGIPNEALKKCELVCTAYNEKTGYPVKDMIYTGSMKFKKRPFPKGRQDESGVLWASTGNADLIRFDPRSEKKSIEPALPFLRSIRINQQSINWYDLDKEKRDSALIARQEELVFGRKLLPAIRDSLRTKFSGITFDSITPFYQVPLGLVLPFVHNYLTIEYGATETNRNFMVRYQYILDGYDKDWNPITEKSSAAYGNISEGSYTFRLKAMSPEGIWSAPISYTFKVLPPLWRTWWMYMLYAIATLSIIGAFIRWRINTLKKEKIILENKVASRTQELSKEKEKVEDTLTELKSTQAQLIQSEKMASLGELTAGIAHEIQNPLNFVNNFSDVNTELLEELKAAANRGSMEEVKAIADDVINNEEKINHHGKRADAIVKGMLQHSRAGNGKKEPTDINQLADEYLKLAYHGYRANDKSFTATLLTDFDQSIGKVMLVSQDISRVLLNLYNNAFYAVHAKASAAATNNIDGYTPQVRVTTYRQNGKLCIAVHDNGTGIPEAIRQKIFQPFFTTKPTGQGTGLGLSLSYDIITRGNGGNLKVNSTEGEGTEFIIELPT